MRPKIKKFSSLSHFKTEPCDSQARIDERRKLIVGVTRLKQNTNSSNQQKEHISTKITFLSSSLTKSRMILESPYGISVRDRKLRAQEEIETLKGIATKTNEILAERERETEQFKESKFGENRLEKGDALRRLKMESRMIKARIELRLARSHSKNILELSKETTLHQ